MNKKIEIAIFASGGGSNAENIIQYFENHAFVNISLIVSNKNDAFVLERAKNHQIETLVHSKKDIESGSLLSQLKSKGIEFIVLAGYLKKIGDDLISTYPNRIINIHPALLPKFGGKGMYGMNVHKAVVEAKEKYSGPTIHLVNERYDEGAIIEQHKVAISQSDSANDVAAKVLKLEHRFYAKCIEKVIQEQWKKH